MPYKQVIRENSRLYFVFEYVKGDLLGLMRERAQEPFTEAWIRNVVFQVLQVSWIMWKFSELINHLETLALTSMNCDSSRYDTYPLLDALSSSFEYC